MYQYLLRGPMVVLLAALTTGCNLYGVRTTIGHHDLWHDNYPFYHDGNGYLYYPYRRRWDGRYGFYHPEHRDRDRYIVDQRPRRPRDPPSWWHRYRDHKPPTHRDGRGHTDRDRDPYSDRHR